jgi:8-oxo-dGTP pyrophosphatase MutT (NUDIX family)
MLFDLKGLHSSLPELQVISCDSVDVRLSEAAHPIEALYKSEIEANWLQDSANNPKLFNGRVTLASKVSFDAGILTAETHEVDFSSFLYWRKNQALVDAFHLFGFAVPVASGGELIAVRMGEDTANAGRVYFAAGSIERQDFVNGKLDLPACSEREAEEETGLKLAYCRRDDKVNLVRAGSAILMFRRYFLEDTVDEIDRRIQAHISTEVEREIDGIVVLRSAESLPKTLRHIPPLLAWHFSASN